MPNSGSEKPNGVVRFDHNVVGRIERLALELVHQHRDGAVIFGARHAPGIVLAGDEAALAIASIAVRIVRRLAKYGGAAGLLVPPQDTVVRNVAPQHAASVTEPHRPLTSALR
jgi:hypothetical protein